MKIRLYELITKIMYLLEKDLAYVESNDRDLKLKKNITSILDRLVSLIVQLNKLSKDEEIYITSELGEEDIAIIERFISNYNQIGQ